MENRDSYSVGAAAIDITPSLDRPVYLAGFAPNRTATSVLHPLEARALYVRDAAGRVVCFASLDLIGFPNPYVERVRDLVQDLLPRERLVVCATHSHSAPDTLGLWGKAFLGIPYRCGVDRTYMDLAVEKTAQAVRQAVASARPATLAAATTEVPPEWVRNDREIGGRYPRMVVLAATEGDEIRALMVNFAAHPEALWEHNRQVSPDYPAPLRGRLAASGVAVPLFFSGPLGAMLTPNVPRKSSVDERRDYIDKMGAAVADCALQALSRAEPLSGPIRVAGRRFALANANRRFDLGRRLGLLDRAIEDGVMKTEVTAGSIGQFRFLTVPGEASPEVGHEFYELLGDGPRMLLCLGQDELGYLIPPAFFSNQAYKYERSMSVGPHAVPTLAATARELLQQVNAPA
jgi:hypothetical protein